MSKVERHHLRHADTRLTAISTLHHHLLMDQLLLEKLDLLLLPQHDRLVNHSLLLWSKLGLSWNMWGHHVRHLHRSHHHASQTSNQTSHSALGLYRLRLCNLSRSFFRLRLLLNFVDSIFVTVSLLLFFGMGNFGMCSFYRLSSLTWLVSNDNFLCLLIM